MTSRTGAVLVLEDGRTFHGESFGGLGQTFGEAVFTTAMTGYQEVLTDPSCHRQIVTMTAAHVGNTGVNEADAESERVWASGVVIRQPSPIVSSWRAKQSLESHLAEAGVVGICGVDTRALTRHLRTAGAMRAGIASTGLDPQALLDEVRRVPKMKGASLTDEVTTSRAYRLEADGAKRFTVAVLDLGVKRNSLRSLTKRGLELWVMPARSGVEEILATGADAVFVSNGPGDPAAADTQVETIRQLLQRRVATFGICMGHQLLARALGLSTYKLDFGHRGVNQPVKDLDSGSVAITSHNHGFAVSSPHSTAFDTPFGAARVTHRCLNDDVLEGLACEEVPAFSVQFHPESAAGTHDADYLFERLVDMMEGQADA